MRPKNTAWRWPRASTLSGRQGQTTLFFAVESRRTDVVRYLLDHGAGTDVVDGMGRRPIDLAAGGGEGTRSQEIVALLQTVGAKRN